MLTNVMIKTLKGLKTSGNIMIKCNVYSFASIRKYTKEHEWVDFNTDTKEGLIGITHFAQKELGEIVHIDLPKIGDAFKQMDVFGAVESVKMASDIYSPVTGTITKVNEDVKKNPKLVNDDAEKNWLVSAKLSDPKELDTLMTKAEYDSKYN